jgi:hypothetical protein
MEEFLMSKHEPLRSNTQYHQKRKKQREEQSNKERNKERKR